jgi:hypothetical protein
VNGRRQRKAERAALHAAAVLIGLSLAWLLAGCAATNEESPELEPISIQTLQYYPFQVKGYQNSFPSAKRIVVLTTPDIRNFKEAGAVSHSPYQGHPAIGVILDHHGRTKQQLYGPELGPLFQNAIAQAAHEAGMVSSVSAAPLAQALEQRQADYVLQAKITGMWVVKQRGADQEGGPLWFTAAQTTLDVAIYKPPFTVPFWQGISNAEYSDPPTPPANATPADETEIYDQPGEVLSVALTRAVAGIFRHQDLHTLVLQDAVSPQ